MSFCVNLKSPTQATTFLDAEHLNRWPFPSLCIFFALHPLRYTHCRYRSYSSFWPCLDERIFVCTNSDKIFGKCGLHVLECLLSKSDSYLLPYRFHFWYWLIKWVIKSCAGYLKLHTTNSIYKDGIKKSLTMAAQQEE